MKQTDIETILKKVKSYTDNKNVIAILAFGSVLNSNFDQYSDFDIYVITKNKGKYDRVNFNFGTRRIDVLFDTKDDLKKYLAEEAKIFRKNVSCMISKSRIIYGDEEKIVKLIKIAQENLDSSYKPNKNELMMHNYSINDFWRKVKRAYKKGDRLSFDIYSFYLLNNIIELYLKLKGNCYCRIDEILELIKQDQPELAEKINAFYQADSFENRYQKLENLILYTDNILNSKLHDEFVIEIE